MTEKFENDAIANFVSTELDKFMHKVDSSSNYGKYITCHCDVWYLFH